MSLISGLSFYITWNILENNTIIPSGLQAKLEQMIGIDSKKADKTFTSEDGSVQVIASEDWKTTDIHEQAILQIANRAKNKYIIVIDESKVDFADKTTIFDFAKLVLDGMKETTENVSVSEPTKVIINNYPGLQYYFQGEVDKIKVSYNISLIDTPETFYQVIAWSLQSNFDEYKEEFKTIISTFKSFGNKSSDYLVNQ